MTDWLLSDCVSKQCGMINELHRLTVLHTSVGMFAIRHHHYCLHHPVLPQEEQERKSKVGCFMAGWLVSDWVSTQCCMVNPLNLWASISSLCMWVVHVGG